MSDPSTNLEMLKRSRKKPQVGDVFAMLPPDGKYLFGRVIRTDAMGPMKALLIYIYAYRSEEKKPPQELTPRSLLIPPACTNALGWTHGRFETIENRPLETGDVLERHCFYADDRYYDEDWQVIPERTEPCGFGGLVSYRFLDDEISDALEIPHVPV